MMRLLALLAFCLTGISSAWSAGSIPVALAQQMDPNGKPLVGCLLYLYQVGSVASPQLAYQDTGLSNALQWPVPCDANGRLPMFYLADGSVHARLTDAGGSVQFDYPTMLVIGPSGGGAGGGTVDPTTIASTGDVKFRFTAEFVTGWVKMNGQTVGSAVSGASQRANADTLNLFTYLWTNCPDAHCAVPGGRGASAAADFAANKQITLPDWRARIPVGRDCMEASCASRLYAGNVTSGGGDGPDTANASGGSSLIYIQQSNLPNIGLTSSGNTLQGVSINTNQAVTQALTPAAVATGGGALGIGSFAAAVASITIPSFTVTTSLGGSGFGLTTMNPFILGTWYCKL